MMADVSIQCERVASVRAWWQEYRRYDDSPVERIVNVGLLDTVGSYDAAVEFRGRIADLRALINALIEAVDLLERVPAEEHVRTLTSKPVDTDSVDPVDL